VGAERCVCPGGEDFGIIEHIHRDFEMKPYFVRPFIMLRGECLAQIRPERRHARAM
jgi:hypothetical protein